MLRSYVLVPSSTALRSAQGGPGEQILRRRAVEGAPARRPSSRPAIPTRAPAPAGPSARPAGWSCLRGRAGATARTSPCGGPGTDLVDHPQMSRAFVPEPVQLPGSYGDAFSWTEHELPTVHAKLHPALPHAEALRKRRVPVGTGHYARLRPEVLNHQVIAAFVHTLFQKRDAVPVAVHEGVVSTKIAPDDR